MLSLPFATLKPWQARELSGLPRYVLALFLPGKRKRASPVSITPLEEAQGKLPQRRAATYAAIA